ncbi:MAG: indolepyruvate ferredoxin oxidoreductase subunit beta [Candidatus Baldrarchaeia archaeon]|mgnify:CR=1 FL=1
MIEEFNIMIVGVGGTGVLTLSRILGHAAVLEGEKVRVGEIHGMAQRGGSVFCEVRIGNKVYSPIIPQGRADILISLEPVEALRAAYKVSSKSIVLMNTHPIIPPVVSLGLARYPSLEEILEKMRKFSSKIIARDFTELAKEVGTVRVLNTLMLGVVYSIGKIPLRKESIERAIEDVIPPRFVSINIEAFRRGIAEGQGLVKEQIS